MVTLVVGAGELAAKLPENAEAGCLRLWSWATGAGMDLTGRRRGAAIGIRKHGHNEHLNC